MKTYFAAPWGRSVKVISFVVSAFLLGAPLTAIILGARSGIALWIVLAPVALWVVTLPFMVRAYVLTPKALYIERLGWRSVWSLEAVRSAQHRFHVMAGSLRLFGNGGLFAVCGYFKSRQLGYYRAFVTNAENTIVLKLGDKTVVISPERPQEFVRAIRGT